MFPYCWNKFPMRINPSQTYGDGPRAFNSVRARFQFGIVRHLKFLMDGYHFSFECSSSESDPYCWASKSQRTFSNFSK